MKEDVAWRCPVCKLATREKVTEHWMRLTKKFHRKQHNFTIKQAYKLSMQLKLMKRGSGNDNYKKHQAAVEEAGRKKIVDLGHDPLIFSLRQRRKRGKRAGQYCRESFWMCKACFTPFPQTRCRSQGMLCQGGHG